MLVEMINRLLWDRPDLSADRLAVYRVLKEQIDAQAALIAVLTEELTELKKERLTPDANEAARSLGVRARVD